MNTEILSPLYHQARLELAQLVRKWEGIHETLLITEGPISDVCFVDFAALYQHTRCFMRLLSEDYAEEGCVVSETLCTLILSGFVDDSLPLRRQLSMLIKDLCRVIRWHIDNDSALPFEKQFIDASIYKNTLRLQRYVITSAPREYQHFSRVFPVNAYEDDSVFLRVRGFDLLRLDAENLSLYLLEFDWHSLIERGSCLYSLFAHIALNGHVFDVRHARQAYCEPEAYATGVLRLLYGTPLELDFVQAISRVPGNQIFAVDKTRIFSHEPSWGRASASMAAQNAQQSFSMEDLTPLINAYDAALSRAFAEAKAPRPFEPMEGYE